MKTGIRGQVIASSGYVKLRVGAPNKGNLSKLKAFFGGV